jgi:hypothetical protein
LSRTLREIAATDPSAEGHTGPDTPAISARYARRNDLVWQALTQARDAGLPAGVGLDPADPHPVVVYLELPTGQVSWHLPDDGRHHGQPAYAGEWDGHTTAEKYMWVDLYIGTHGPFTLCPVERCARCGEIAAAMEDRWRARMEAQGTHLVDVAALSPEERAEHDREEEYAAMAAEHQYAAGPDPDFGRDGVW